MSDRPTSSLAGLLTQPIGRWRCDLLFRFFGLVIFQVDMMGASDARDLASLLAFPVSFFAQILGALLLVGFGARPIVLLYAALSMTWFFCDAILGVPGTQLAEEYGVLIGLPIVSLIVAFAAHTSGGDEEQVDVAVIAAFRLTAIVVMFFAAFHKFNADFFDPAVSCAMGLAHFYAGLIPGASSISQLDAVLALTPWFAFLGEAIIPILLLISARVGILTALVVMGAIGHWDTTGFTTLVVMLSSSFLRHEDAEALRDGFRRHWPFLVVAPLALAFATVRLYAGIRWFEYHLFEIVLLTVGLAVFEAMRFDWKHVRPGESTWKAVLRPGVALGGLLPERRAVRIVLLLAVAAGLANGVTPYVGAKFRSSFAMFSNLRVDQDRWNHFIVPDWFDFREHDGFLRVLHVWPQNQWYFEGKPVDAALYSPIGLRRRLYTLPESAEFDMQIEYEGTRRGFQGRGAKHDLERYLRELSQTKFIHEKLTAGGPQVCVH